MLKLASGGVVARKYRAGWSPRDPAAGPRGHPRSGDFSDQGDPAGQPGPRSHREYWQRKSYQRAAQAAAWCEYLAAHPRRLYGAVTDAARGAAALLATRLAAGRLARPFTAREVHRQEWTGLTEPRVVQSALECLQELGWIRPDDGGRPTVRFHLNPRLRADGPPRARGVRPRGAPKPLQ